MEAEIKLTHRQKLFCYEYLKDNNGQEAYKRAYGEGLSDEVARVNASRLLTKANVKELIENKNDEIFEKLGISNEKIINEYAKIAFSDITEYVTFNEDNVNFVDSENIDGSVISEVSAIKTITRSGEDETTEKINMKIKLHDKRGALDSLAKHKGLLQERIDITSKGKPINPVINVNINGSKSKLLEED